MSGIFTKLNPIINGDSSQFLVNILDSVCHPILIIDTETYEVRMANSAVLEGKTLEPGITCHQLTHHCSTPCDSSQHPCPLRITLETREPCSVEHIHYDRAGNRKYVEVHANPIFDEKQEIVYIIEYAIDVTEQKEALLRMESQNQFLQLLIDTIPIPIFYKNNRGVYTGCNHAFCDYLGKDYDQIVGHTVFDVAPGELARIYHQADLDLIEANKSQTYESQVLHGDGSLKDVIFYKAAFESEDGHTGLIGIMLDITDRKNAERDRRKNEQRLNTIFDAILQGILVVDPETHTILDLNKTTEQMIGLPREEIIGKVCHEFICPSQKGQCPITDLNQEIDCAQRQLIDAKGERIDVLKSVKKIELLSRTVLLESFTDISRQKQTEGELLEAKGLLEDAWSETEQVNRQLELSVEKANLLAQEASLANVAKSEFLANMSHEIRTPINAIMGFGELLAQEELTGDQTEYVDIINTSTKTLLNLINDILDFSKIEAGHLELEKICCSLADIIEPVVTIMKPQAEKKGLSFEYFAGEDLPESLCVDPTRVKQCLMNLISNAVKFTEEGKVTVRCEHKLPGCGKQPAIGFVVKDSGIGIDLKKQSQIFEPFSQADSSTTRKFGGTGLGLSITKNLTEMMGGTLTLRSEPGKGCEFTLIVPYQNGVSHTNGLMSSDRAKNQGDSRNYETLRGRILLAEDNPSNQMLIRKLVEKTGCELTVVGDGKQAVDAVKECSFDLILMDMQMPVMNGYQASKSLRNQKVERPIIALTANAMTGDRDECMKAGCTDYLAKPINHQRFFVILEKYLCPQHAGG